MTSQMENELLTRIGPGTQDCRTGNGPSADLPDWNLRPENSAMPQRA